MSGPKAILLSDCFSGFMFNTSTLLNSIKIEFYLGKILLKSNLCLLELSVGFFQTLLGIWTLAKNVILEVYFMDMKCICLLLYLIFLLLFQPPRNCRSFGNVLIMPQVKYFSPFFVGLQNSIYKDWALSLQPVASSLAVKFPGLCTELCFNEAPKHSGIKTWWGPSNILMLE